MKGCVHIKKLLFEIIYTLVLVVFTVYVLLDTFVITRTYTTVPLDKKTDSSYSGAESSYSCSQGELTTENSYSASTTSYSYKDENISVTVTEYRETNTSIYVADVKLSSPEYLKTAFANGAYGKNVTEKTSEIAKGNNAILAINGDYYGVQEKGYVLRNGILYRNTPDRDREDLVIYDDGSFNIITETSISAKELLNNGAVQILSFGPALVLNGSVSVTEEDEVGKAMTSNPRTCIGITDDLHYLFVVSDGRTKASSGLTLYELAEFMQSLGASVAYNLDGGGSSTMYFGGEVINNPTTNGKRIKERSVSDIVYIGY